MVSFVREIIDQQYQGPADFRNGVEYRQTAKAEAIIVIALNAVSASAEAEAESG